MEQVTRWPRVVGGMAGENGPHKKKQGIRKNTAPYHTKKGERDAGGILGNSLRLT